MNELYHYGIKRRSGRYPWGSGDRPYQRLENLEGRIIQNESTNDVARIQKLKHFFQKNKFMFQKKIGKDFSNVGMSYLSEHDFSWQEVEERQFPDGSIGYFPPAFVIDEFAKKGRNPYPFKDSIPSNYEIAQNVNPGFGERGTTKNCTKTSAAYAMCRKGYAVNAGRQSDSGSMESFLNWFDDATLETANGDNIRDKLSNFGSGSYGALRIKYDNTDVGHAVNWSINDNNEIDIIDCQNGKVFAGDSQWTSGDSLSNFLDSYGANESDFYYVRLDNCTPNFKSMSDDSVIRIANRSSKVRNKYSGGIVDTW